MSEPISPKSVRLRQSGLGTMSDGSAPAQPRQVARLQFLGVGYREPLTIVQAGILIDRTNADPEYAAKIEQWHVRKFELHPALYPPVGAAVVVPPRLTVGTEFHLPPRGETEPNATIFQKRRLELFSGCDFPVMDSLGREQAGALIAFLESQAVARSLETLRADAETRLRETGTEAMAPQTASSKRTAGQYRPPRTGSLKWVLLGTMAALGLTLFLFFASVEKWVDGHFTNAATETPGADPLKLAVAASQTRALKKYPALGVAGSPFNTAFVARYQQLSQQRSPWLASPNWPERIADDCALRLPAKYH